MRLSFHGGTIDLACVLINFPDL